MDKGEKDRQEIHVEAEVHSDEEDDVSITVSQIPERSAEGLVNTIAEIRTRKRTEKGRKHSLEVRKKNRKTAATTVENKIKEIEGLKKENKIEQIEEEYEVFLDLLEDFQFHHQSYSLLLCGDDEEKDEQGIEIEQKFLRFKTVAAQWISDAVNDTIKPTDSVSQAQSTESERIHRIAQLNMKKEITKLNVEKAELEDRLQLEKIQMDLEKQQMDLKLKRIHMKHQAELERIQIEEEISSLSGNTENKSGTSKLRRNRIVQKQQTEKIVTALDTHPSRHEDIDLCSPTPTIKTHQPQNTPDVPVQETTRNSQVEDSSHVGDPHPLTQVVRELKKPKCEVKKFGGNILEYRKFLRQLNTNALKLTDDFEEKMSLLESHTYGKANKIVTGYSHMDPELGFIRTMEDFEEIYGDPELLAAAYSQKALAWPTIRYDDSKALDEYFMFLCECQHAMEGNKSLQVMEYSGNLKKLVAKLPFYIQDKWRTKYQEIKDKKSAIKFEDLVNLVKKESKKANDPVYGKDAMKTLEIEKRHDSNRKFDRNNNRQRVNFSSDEKTYNRQRTYSEDRRRNEPEKNGQVKPCTYCQKDHPLTNCEAFRKLEHSDKITFLKKEGMCYGCLLSGHMKFTCKRKLICEACNFRHPTAMHYEHDKRKDDDKEQNGKSIKANLIVEDQQRIQSHAGAGSQCTLAIIPVIVRSKNSKRSHGIKTYAFLDPGSTANFITKSLMSNLGISGRRERLTLETMGEPLDIDTHILNGLEICSLDGTNPVELSKVYSKDTIPVSKSHIPTQRELKDWSHLDQVYLPQIEADIGLLKGNGTPGAYTPIEVLTGPIKDCPHAVKTCLGWVVWNIVRCETKPNQDVCNLAIERDKDQVVVSRIEESQSLEDLFRKYINTDFPEKTIDDKREPSLEDKKFEESVRKSILYSEGHYTINLPVRRRDVQLPNNSEVALARLKGIKRKFMSNQVYYEDYCKFMNDILSNGYAEEVPRRLLDRDDGKVYYIPHHGIYGSNEKKSKKIRIVFDCSAKFRGVSLNDLLLPGPNLTNKLVGVLMRFRQENVAIMADVKSMFFQVRVPEDDRDYLRFYWWKDGNYDLDPEIFRMTVHLFGAISSPTCANSALHKTADDFGNQFEAEVADTVRRNFYVDDCLKSTDSQEKAITLAEDLTELCSMGGFKLTKWISNYRTVLDSIPIEEQAKELENLDLDYDELPVEHALGVSWSVEKDLLGFKIKIPVRQPTRRGMLSVVGSVYDPLGLAAPFVLPAKLLLQELCHQGIEWDQKIESKQLDRWNKCLTSLPNLEQLTTPRCHKPLDFGPVARTELHHFSDASDIGFGTVSYVRFINQEERIHCSIIMGKSRVSPMKRKTIPRMELSAATVAVRMNKLISDEMDYPFDETFFWTDSMSVLRYIMNDKTRFHTFVSNRLMIIHEGSRVDQWHWVDSLSNPADYASRGLKVEDISKSNKWLQGPDFLWKQKSEWPKTEMMNMSIPDEDIEVKKVVHMTIVDVSVTTTKKYLSYFSSWTKLRKAVGWKLVLMGLLKKLAKRRKELKYEFKDEPDEERRYKLVEEKMKQEKENLKNKTKHATPSPLKFEYFRKAEDRILAFEQGQHFKEEIDILKNPEKQQKKIKRSSRLSKLDPIYKNGLLRVGGRLDRATIEEDAKHQIILPKDSFISSLIIEYIHRRVGHLGKNSVLAELRQKYWILKANVAIKTIVSRCVNCRKYQAKVGDQKMADLPANRLKFDDPPFTHTGADFFGPIEVKRGRSLVKRYGVIFTCLTTRAVHLEIAHSLDTNSCLNAFRRFIARRSTVKTILTDNGTNFVGVKHELKDAIKEWNQSKISEELYQCDVDWSFDPPTASHFGGIWERQIRTVRKIMHSILKEQVINLDDESLLTLFCEIESIINSRPITRNSDDPNDLEVLTPNHLLLLKSKPDLPPGLFSKDDCYTRRRWRQVQYLANLFWSRWVKEYLPALQERHKWTNPRRNLQEGDIVLLVDNLSHRSSWALGRVTELIMDQRGFVRFVKVKTKSSIFTRPVDKLCLILESEIFIIKGAQVKIDI